MFDGPLHPRGRSPAVLALIAVLAATSLAAARAHAFGLSGTQFVEGLGKAGDTLKAAEEAERHGRSVEEQIVDNELGEIADKAADAIDRGAKKAGKRAWDALAKSDSKAGELAKKAAKRWGPAVRRGLRLAGPVGTVIATADAGITVGSALGKHVAVPLIDGYYAGKSRALEEQLLRDVAEIRKRGEFRRRLDEDIATYEREARAMDEEERRLYAPEGGGPASDPWRDDEGSAKRDPWAPVNSNEPDPWGQDIAVRSRDEWGSEQWDHQAIDAAQPPSGGEVNSSYAAALSDVLGDSVEGGVPEEDYRSALAALERQRAEEREAQRLRDAERRVAETAREADEYAHEIREEAAVGSAWVEQVKVRREQERREAEEREDRSRAHLERTLQIAALQRQLDSKLATCERLEPEPTLCWAPGTPEGRAAACRQRFDQEKRMARSGCRDRARSAYQRDIGILMLNNP